VALKNTPHAEAFERPIPSPWTADRAKWTALEVNGYALLRPIAYNLEAVYYTNVDPTTDDVTMNRFFPARNGIILLDSPGEWFIYVDDPQGAGKMKYIKTEYESLLAAVMAFVMVGGSFLIGGSGGSVDTRNADADADFTQTLIGELVNARCALFNGADWIRMSGHTPNVINSEAHNAQTWLRAAAAAYARDTGDNTMRLIEARGSAGAQVTTLYRLLVDASLRFLDDGSSNWTAMEGDTLSSVSGRPNTVKAAYTTAILAKEDPGNSVLRTVETDRSATSALVNPAALAVGASLDSRGNVNKAVYASASYAGESARLQVSRDNSTWRTVDTQACASGAVAAWTAVDYEFIRGFRYFRVLAVVGGTGTFTSEISAVGA